jgi:hypothetical protein
MHSGRECIETGDKCGHASGRQRGDAPPSVGFRYVLWPEADAGIFLHHVCFGIEYGFTAERLC